MRTFHVDDMDKLLTTKEVAVHDDGRIVEAEGLPSRLPNEPTGTGLRYWYDVRRKTENTENVRSPKQFHLSYSQTTLDSLLHRYYQAGVDMEPEYQRGYEWETSDKLALIDSIFNNRDIGKFVFVERNWEHEERGKMYEILDGKQRLNAIVEFYEDRLLYKDRYFSDLTFEDYVHFDRLFLISLATVTDVTDRSEIVRLFLHLNRGGRIMSPEHLARIEATL